MKETELVEDLESWIYDFTCIYKYYMHTSYTFVCIYIYTCIYTYRQIDLIKKEIICSNDGWMIKL